MNMIKNTKKPLTLKILRELRIKKLMSVKVPVRGHRRTKRWVKHNKRKWEKTYTRIRKPTKVIRLYHKIGVFLKTGEKKFSEIKKEFGLTSEVLTRALKYGLKTGDIEKTETGK